MIKYILQDWAANHSNPTKGKYVVLLFRLAQYLRKRKLTFIIFFWFFIFYRVVIEWFMCIELSWNTSIGPGLQIYHGSGLVIHPKTVIGVNFSIRQCTTIGVKQNFSNRYNNKAPRIGDNVDIGCNSVLIGNISIGSNVNIGAGSIVVKDLPNCCVAAGNPARIIKLQKAMPSVAS